jgi:uroporphyrin-III C-methyltransferase/precorrin-2 dehydrogenase/sirohydrochlorin ferrochelatase
VALVERGTTPLQHMTVTTLKDLVDTIDREDFQPPTLIIVGEVVQLADKLTRPAQAGWNSALTKPAVTAGQRPA